MTCGAKCFVSPCEICALFWRLFGLGPVAGEENRSGEFRMGAKVGQRTATPAGLVAQGAAAAQRLAGDVKTA
jgi:hypothetical protein